MPTTLIQELSLHQPNTRKAVIDTLVRESPLASRIPYESIGALNISAPYLSSIPTIPFRHLNQASTEVSVEFAEQAHSLSIFDADIKIDPVILDIKNKIQNTQVAQAKNTVKAMAYNLVDKYVNGNVTSDAREFDGLQRHLDTNVRFNGQTENATANSTELNLAVGTASDADYRNFWHKMLLAASRVNIGHGLPIDGDAVILSNTFANMVMETSLRQLRWYAESKDMYNRDLMTWKGLQIIDAGWDPGGAVRGAYPTAGAQGDLVIGYDSEAVTATNGGNTYDKQTPIYFIRFGQDFNMGLQQAPMRVKNYGEDPATSPHYNITNIRWVVNPAVAFQVRSWARLVGCNFSGTTS